MRNREKVCNVLKHVTGAMVCACLMSIISIVLSKMDAEEIGAEMTYAQFYLWSLTALIPFTVTLMGVLFLNNFFLYLFLGVLSVLCILLFPIPGLLKALIMVVGGFIVVIRGSARRKGTEDFMMKPHAGFIALFVVAYIIANGYENTLMANVSYYLCFAYAILLLIFNNFTSLNSYLDYNKNVENIPYSQISRTNYGTLAIYLILTISLMIILPHIGLDKLIKNFFDALKDLIAKMINLDFSQGGSESATHVTDPSFEQENPFTNWIPKETPGWLSSLYTGATYVAVGLVIVGLIGALILIASRMMKQFYRTENTRTDRQEFIPATKDKKESTAKKFSDIIKKPEWMDFTPNGQVRRAWKKAVLKSAKETPVSGMTPREAEIFAGLPDNESTRLLHDLYEKARYTEDGCDKADVRALK